MRFSRIWLENWRNFSEVDVALQNRAFIIGANASGKSNFLDVFRFLHDLVANGFQKAVESRGGVSHIRRLPAADVIIEVELSQDDTVTWRYRIVFSGNNRPLLKEEKIWRDDQPVLNRPD
jgi:predicted ATPase